MTFYITQVINHTSCIPPFQRIRIHFDKHTFDGQKQIVNPSQLEDLLVDSDENEAQFIGKSPLGYVAIADVLLFTGTFLHEDVADEFIDEIGWGGDGSRGGGGGGAIGGRLGSLEEDDAAGG